MQRGLRNRKEMRMKTTFSLGYIYLYVAYHVKTGKVSLDTCPWQNESSQLTKMQVEALPQKYQAPVFDMEPHVIEIISLVIPPLSKHVLRNAALYFQTMRIPV